MFQFLKTKLCLPSVLNCWLQNTYFKRTFQTSATGERNLSSGFWDLDNFLFEETSKTILRLEKLLLSFIGSRKGIDQRKQNLFNLLYDTNGNLSVEEYAREVFWTSRQINRYFNQTFGLSLKAYCKILKCHASYKQIKNGNFFPEQNYFDQPHFIKEIQKHTGTVPTELHLNKNDRFLQLATMSGK